MNTTREKVSKNYKLKQSCVLTAFSLRHVRSYHVLTARPPRHLRAYGVSCEIYGLGNGDHGRSRGALTTSSTCIASVRRPPGVSTTFSRRLYIKRIKFVGNFQRIIVQSYCTINIWCSISKFWISSDMRMNTKYSDENDVVVVRTPWNRGRVEDPMIAFANVTIFAASLPRVYCACTTSMEMLRRLAHDLRDPTAFQVRSPNLGVCFAQNKRRDSAIIGDHGDHSTMSGVSTTFIPRLYHAYGDLGALWTHFPSP